MNRCARLVEGPLALIALVILLAGLPLALAYFVGWPLPDHLPTWEEIETTLLNPMSGELFINVLVVVCWIAWFRFALGVLQSVLDIARDIAWSPTQVQGPLRSTAATLVAAVLLTLVSNRALAIEPVAMTNVPPVQAETVSTTGTPNPDSDTPAAVAAVGPAAQVPPGFVHIVEEVRPPHNGTYDSMWRIAERVFGPGGGVRWPELYELNRGVAQADGRSLADPDLVRPGWKIAAYVFEPRVEAPKQVPPSTDEGPSSTASVPTSHIPVVDPSLTEQDVGLRTGIYLSAGLAGTVSAALLITQIRRRRQYRLGSGKRSDLQRPLAPAVRALRNAYEVDPGGSREKSKIVDFDLGTTSPRVSAPIGEQKGRELLLNLASARGLGLTGPGALSAARALLLHLLTTQQSEKAPRLLVPANDLRMLFEDCDVHDLPKAIEVVASLDHALDEMEASLLTRARGALEEAESGAAAAVLIASVHARANRRVQALLDNGSTLGFAGVLLGRWSAGATVVVHADGLVTASDPVLCAELTGARLFNLPSVDALDLLAVLHDAETDQVVAQRGDSARNQEVNTAVAGRSPVTPLARLTVKVLGRIRLTCEMEGSEARELSGLLTPKQREVLVHLALHPDGVRREALNEAVWPDSRPPRPYNSFHNTMSVLRRVLSEATSGSMTNVVMSDGGRYQLNHEVVTVDLWRFRQMLHRVHDAGPDRRVRLQRAIDLYEGDLAEDLLTPWIEPFRESVRRDVLDAYSGLIHLQGKASPESVLELLERARGLDPYNEGIYRDIMRTQAQLGQHAAVPRTLALLTSVLSEIDEQPSPDSGRLAELLQRRGNAAVLASQDRAAAS